jgi:phosphatidate phosphatase APP1
LSISFADSEELRAGNTVTLKLKVRRRSGNGRKNVGDARVTVKTLGTNFPPQSTFATTDNRGAATVSISLPHFTAGRGAVLIQVESNGEVAELRKIILPANE